MAYLNQGGLDYFWEKVKEYANSTITVSPKEVSGSICTFDDGSETPVKSLSVNIEPVQTGSGAPSPDNIRPISGWDGVNVVVSGKNLLKPDKAAVGNTIVNLGTTNGSGGNADISVFGIFLKAGVYTFSAATNGSLPSWNCRTEYNTEIIRLGVGANFSGQLTIEKDSYIRIWAYLSNGISPYEISWFQLELGSVATTYEPYKGTVYPISLPSTVYGGVLDVENGTLTVTKKMAQITSTSAIYYESTAGGRFRIAGLLTGKIETSGYDTDLLCSYYKADSSPTQSGVVDYSICGWRATDVAYIIDRRFETAEAYKAWLADNPVAVVYNLATPLTLSLTPAEVRTILGYNNIYADSGEVSVVYCPQAAQKPTIEGVKTSTISVSTGTEADLLDEAVAVKAGHSYAISYAAQFAANSTGYRRTKVYVDGTDAGVIAADIQPAVSGAETVCRGEHWFAASSNGEVMIKGLQNSGGALFASTSVRIIDLGN